MALVGMALVLTLAALVLLVLQVLLMTLVRGRAVEDPVESHSVLVLCTSWVVAAVEVSRVSVEVEVGADWRRCKVGGLVGHFLGRLLCKREKKEPLVS